MTNDQFSFSYLWDVNAQKIGVATNPKPTLADRIQTCLKIYDFTVKAASIRELKQELSGRSKGELLDLCLHLSKFRKENKEFLTYLLYEALDEPAYVAGVKSEIEQLFEQINKRDYYFIKKSVRKIIRTIKKYIQYSKKKETEVDLLLCFCGELKKLKPSIENNKVLKNIYEHQIEAIKKAILSLHEDLQFDYQMELKKLGK